MLSNCGSIEHREIPVGRASRVRYQVVAVACVLAVLTYINRLGFGVAAPEIKKDLGFTDDQMGYLASAFLVAYGLCQVPGGMLGDRFGTRYLLTLLVLAWSVLSGATALALGLTAVASLPFVFLLTVRFLFGVFQSAEFPSLTRVIADWMPVQERASAQGVIWMSSRLGGALVPFLFAGMLWFFGTWTTPFWVMAGMGMLWSLVFWPWFRNKPEQMPQVNEAERGLIAAGRPVQPAAAGHMPWYCILGSVNVWALCGMYSIAGFAGNFFTNMLPLYVSDHRHLTGMARASVSSVPLFFGIASCLLGGLLSDWIVRRWGSRKWGRRVNGLIGLGLAGLMTLCIPFAENVWLLGFLVGAAFFFNDLNIAPAWAAAADIGEQYAGTVSGAMNMACAFTAAAGTAFTGWMLRAHRLDWLFIIFACAFALGALCWLAVDVTQPLVPCLEAPAAEAVPNKVVAGDPAKV
jgi:sugar phosphate permease